MSAMLTEQEAQAILQKVLSFKRADELEAILRGGRAAYTRFGVNTESASGDRNDIALVINARSGQKSGVATTNTLDDAGLERTVRAAEEIARLRPADTEQQPLLGAQRYTPTSSFDEATFAATTTQRAQGIAATIDPARARSLSAAGLFDHTGEFIARANSRGNSGYAKTSMSSFTTTVRTADATGSGWGSAMSYRVGDLDTRAIGARAIEKAVLSRNPQPMEPGHYTVILEPNAAGDLLASLMGFFSARTADEGRSFLGQRGGQNRIGEKVFGEQVNIYTDPYSPLAPGLPFDDEGQPTRRMDFVREGVVKNLYYSRYWAVRRSEELSRTIEPTPTPTNIIMEGGNTSVEEMIRTTERGILVTRFWYIRLVDAQTVLYTGLTRDGVFLVENGRIKQAIKNFRFNESPVKMLNNIEAMSPPVRITGSERAGAGRPLLAPALKVRDFNFTSLSEAV